MPKLTKRYVEDIEPDTERDIITWDRQVAGFGLRVKPSGRKTYILQYRNAHGRSRRLTLGVHGVVAPAAARKEAKRLLGEVASGEDPAERRRRARHSLTVRELAQLYLDEHLIPKRKPISVYNFKGEVRRHIGPRLGNRKITAVTRADVERLHRALADRPVAANRVVKNLSAMFNFAERRELRSQGSNPCRYVTLYKEHPRQRYLSPAEVARLGDALVEVERTRQFHPTAFLGVRLLILTGMRSGEVRSMKWEYIDHERSCVHLPDSKTGPKTVPLPAPALELLHSAERLKGNPYVCWGVREGLPLASFQTQWEAVRRAAGLEDVRLHDLRHTYASFGVGAGFGLFVIGKVLGHAQASTTERYAHLGNDPVWLAADAIGRQIAEALQGQSRKEDEDTATNENARAPELAEAG